MKKKFLITLIASLMLCCLAFVGCGGNDDTTPTETLTLSKTSVELEINDEITLTAEYNGTATIEWSSDNSSQRKQR